MTKLSRGDDGTTSKDIDWLIAGRDNNQRQNAALLWLLKEHEDILKLDENKNLLGIAHLLVGTCFSLWRAVFLGIAGEPPRNTYQDAIDFLKKVIIDNAIGYPQEKGMRHWTFGYYLNNAYYRLLEIRKRDLGFLKDSEFLEKLLREGGSPPSTQTSWENCQEEAGKAIEFLKQILEADS